MNRSSFARMTKTVLFAMLVLPVSLAAQQIRYKIVDLGTFGGPNSSFPGPLPVAQDVNDRGVAVGQADLNIADPLCIFDCFVTHAFKWRNGSMTDLGTLPGGTFSGANWITARGTITGGADNGIIDPMLGVLEFHAVIWTKDNQIVDLGTLGGGQSLSNDMNDRDQIVGLSTNTIPDPFSFLGVQTRAYLWENGVMRDLGSLGGTDAAAWFINNSGQVAGFSFVNSTPNPNTGIPPIHPFLWENGKMQDLGSLGGSGAIGGNFNEGFSVEINALNESGEVAGTSPLAGDQTHHAFLWKGSMIDLGTLGGNNSQGWWVSNSGLVVGRADFSPQNTAHHAFLWKNGTITDLGTLGSCQNSTAFAVNSNGQVVGDTGRCADGGGGPSFYSENGQPMVDINSLVLPGSDIEVVDAIYINDRGEVAGTGFLPNGDFHAVLLVPASADEIAAANALNPPQAFAHATFKNLEDSTSRWRGGKLNRLLRMQPLP